MNLNCNFLSKNGIDGRLHVGVLCGKIAARDGKFVGTIGRGRMLKREPAHF